MTRPVFFLLLLLCSTGLHAQLPDDIVKTVTEKMEWYNAFKKPSSLFVHFDKNIYSSNENVWLAAYLLKAAQALEEHHTLSVTLVRNDDSVVVSEDKFLMAKGLAFGNIILPDSLRAGNYSFIVTTNLFSNGYPVTVFVQPITIKTADDPTFIASLNIVANPSEQDDSVKVLIRAYAKDIFTLISFADVSYSAGSGANKITGKLKTNISGEVNLKLPAKQLMPGNNLLKVQVTYKKETRHVQIQLPVQKKDAVVKFYPEGGHLSEGINNLVGWEVKNEYGEPLMLSAVLYKDGQVEDTIQTNGYGFGRFILVPSRGSHYQVKLIREKKLSASYSLPGVIEGPAINIPAALCNDTLRIGIQNKCAAKFYCILHNYTEVFAGFPITTNSSALKIIKVALTEVPKGIIALTILDSLGRPCAERMIFAHYNKRTAIDITTDSAEYMTRQKVKLSLQLKNVSGNAVKGFVSIACVQDNRLNPLKMTDIESFTYLRNELEPLPFKKNRMGEDPDNMSYLEDVLLIKGWRRYSWPELMNVKAEDTLSHNESLIFTGTITRNAKPVTRAFPVSYLTDSSFGLITTDQKGYFAMETQTMVISPGKKIMLFVNDKNKEDYAVQLKDPYHDISSKLLQTLPDDNMEERSTEKSTETMVLKTGEKAHVLATVTVVADKKDASFYGSLGRNKCGDYVCQYNILNCPNHSYGTLPVEGKIYRTVMGASMANIVYHGCAETKDENKYMFFVKGIYTAKEFYNTDYTKVNASEQMFLSTLYWNYSVMVNSSGKTELSFYTSDIAGKFRIVAQGITTDGVVHSEYLFNVKKK